MKILSAFFAVLVCTPLAVGQGITIRPKTTLGAKTAVGIGTGIPGPFNYTVCDWSAGTTGGTPTATTVQNSCFPLPSGFTATITNPNTDLTYQSSAVYKWPSFTVNSASWPNNSTVGYQFAMGNGGNLISFNFPSSTVRNVVSLCFPMWTSWPQSSGAVANNDTGMLLSSGGGFYDTFQLNNSSGTSLISTTEFGSGEGANQVVWPTSTWQIVCSDQELNVASGYAYQGQWLTPQNGGTIISGSLNTTTTSSSTGDLNNNLNLGSGAATSGGPSGYNMDFGTVVFCGMTSAQNNCQFPLQGLGLQPYAPVISPTSESSASPVTVTMADTPSTNTYSTYYTTCTTTSCTPTTPTCGSTLYNGSFSATPPEAVSAVTCTGTATDPASPVATVSYTVPASPGTLVQSCGKSVFSNSITINSSGGGTACSSTTTGNAAYIFVYDSASVTITTPSASCGVSSWSDLGSGSAVTGTMQWYTGTIATGGSCAPTVSVSGSSNNLVAAFVEVNGTAGLDTGTNPVYNYNTSFCSTGCSGVLITDANSGDLNIYMFIGYGGTNVLSAMTTYTIALQNEAGGANMFAIASYGNSSSGSVYPTFTQSAGDPYPESQIALKP